MLFFCSVLDSTRDEIRHRDRQWKTTLHYTTFGYDIYFPNNHTIHLGPYFCRPITLVSDFIQTATKRNKQISHETQFNT
jgi:hypothetical protein